jgi:hypothetical protein
MHAFWRNFKGLVENENNNHQQTDVITTLDENMEDTTTFIDDTSKTSHEQECGFILCEIFNDLLSAENSICIDQHIPGLSQKNDRGVLVQYRPDVFIPALHLAIEYQGAQHYAQQLGLSMCEVPKRQLYRDLGIHVFFIPDPIIKHRNDLLGYIAFFLHVFFSSSKTKKGIEYPLFHAQFNNFVEARIPPSASPKSYSISYDNILLNLQLIFKSTHKCDILLKPQDNKIVLHGSVVIWSLTCVSKYFGSRYKNIYLFLWSDRPGDSNKFIFSHPLLTDSSAFVIHVPLFLPLFTRHDNTPLWTPNDNLTNVPTLTRTEINTTLYIYYYIVDWLSDLTTDTILKSARLPLVSHIAHNFAQYHNDKPTSEC